MSRSATVVAHPNIALSKYWGKASREGNFPAVPSLSVTLSGMSTRTSVRFHDAAADSITLGGAPMTAGLAKVKQLLDTVRTASGIHAFATIDTVNDFPTGSGLASSASGFAALALAAVRAAGLDWDAERVSGLARAASASAARSLFGGFVELPYGSEGARPCAPKDALPLRVLVCVATEEAKKVASTDGMTRTANESPYYAAWLDTAPRLHEALRAALLRGDFSEVGSLAERSALAMHASAFAAGVVYVKGVTLEALEAVRGLRAKGIEAYATMDAGPHVKVLVREQDVARVREAMASVDGVLRVIDTAPGDGARVVAETA
jgi:diphosphomevalonate decarboxylase